MVTGISEFPVLTSWATNGLIALVGSSAHFFYILRKEQKSFTFGAWCPNLVLSLFIGNLIASLNIPAEYLTAAILVAGFSVYEIFDALENKMPKVILSILDRLLVSAQGSDSGCDNNNKNKRNK